MANVLETSSVSQRVGNLPTGRELFTNIQVRWTAPELHIIMGASGSGKSTLLKTLGGVWRPSRGELRFGGQDLWRQDADAQVPELLGRIGFAFQNNALFNSMRVIENLLYAYRLRGPQMTERARTDHANAWLAKVGLEDAALVFPHEISGGMQKRLAVARTLILEPDFIFLDDPTAGLDPITAQQISDLLVDLLRGRNALVVIVTNDADRALGWSENIHFLDDDRLVSPADPAYAACREAFL